MGACTWRVCALRRWISQQGRASSRGTDWSVPETFKEPKNGHAASLPRSTYFHSKNRPTNVQTRERVRMSEPKRIQRKRTKGWKMPEGAVNVTRPGKHGNPFKIGGYFKIGNGRSGFAYLECLVRRYLTSEFVKVETAEQAVKMFR